jgi:methylenetetrahydrofolate reductase (NADPH)
LYATLAAAQELDLDFASVTYGAGGSTRERTLSLVERLQNELTIDAMAHLTCVGHSQAELDSILAQLKVDGIPAVMALRGDPPNDDTHFTPHPEGFNYASELIEFIRSRYDFKIGCASYPEGHVESANVQQDIDFLKHKQDCGADFTITQLFFDNEDFYRFRDAARAAGVTIPILAGIMPVTAVKQLKRFRSLCGCSIPKKLSDYLTDGSDTSVVEKGIIYGVRQVQDLLDNDIEGIHLYTLNKSYSSAAIIAELHKRGYYSERSKN